MIPLCKLVYLVKPMIYASNKLLVKRDDAMCYYAMISVVMKARWNCLTKYLQHSWKPIHKRLFCALSQLAYSFCFFHANSSSRYRVPFICNFYSLIWDKKPFYCMNTIAKYSILFFTRQTHKRKNAIDERDTELLFRKVIGSTEYKNHHRELKKLPKEVAVASC